MTLRRLHAHEDLMSTFRRVHFIGIGGVGMSGIAEVLHNLGYAVSGSDRANSPSAQRLQQLGISVHVGHAAEHIGDADVVVTSARSARTTPNWSLHVPRVFR
jgi:UDP-N-acetylmuramate--alanine ligase